MKNISNRSTTKIRKQVSFDGRKLTAILVRERKIRGYTAYFEQYPNVISNGDTEKDTIINLIELLRVELEDMAERNNGEEEE